MLLLWHGPLTRYVKLRVAHAPGMPGTFFPPPRVSDPDMHHCTCVMHVPWCMPGSLTSGFLWNRWREKRSRHSRPMCNPQFYVSGKRPIEHKPSFDKINKARNVSRNQQYTYMCSQWKFGNTIEMFRYDDAFVPICPPLKILRTKAFSPQNMPTLFDEVCHFNIVLWD